MTYTKVSKNAIVPAMSMSLVLSLLFFGVIYSIIRGGATAVNKKETLPTIDFVRLKRDSELETLSRSKPPAPPPSPPPTSKLQIATQTVTQQAIPAAVDIPSLNLKADINGAVMVGSKGAGPAEPPTAALLEGDIIPLSCPEPVYPSVAQRAKLTGSVTIEVLVGPDGSPRSGKVVESKPRGLFDASAMTAIMRCKFKPRMENGVAVEQTGRRTFNFSLNQ